MFEDIFFEGIGLEYGVVWCLGRADVCKAASLCRQVLSRLPLMPQPEFVVGYHLYNICELDVHWVYILFWEGVQLVSNFPDKLVTPITMVLAMANNSRK